MPKESKKPEELVIKGRVNFSHHDPHYSRYHMEEEAGENGPMIVSSEDFSIKPSFLGPDFDPTQQYTEGDFVITIRKGKK
jgi:hypothetical protein